MQNQSTRQVTITSHIYDNVNDAYPTDRSINSTYHSAVSPRVYNISRARGSGFGASGAGVTTRIYQSFQANGGSAHGNQGLAALANMSGIPIRGAVGASTALVSVNSLRQRDKRDLEVLNDKFAQYLEKVRFLEAQNRKLLMELEALKGRSGQGSSRIKEIYETEIDAARKLIADTKEMADKANAKALRAEDDVKQLRFKYDRIAGVRETNRAEIDAMQRQIAENQAQINLYNRRIADLDDEIKRYKAQSQRLNNDIAQIQREIQNEAFLKSACDVEKVALEDELATLKDRHAAELAELRARNVSTDLDPSKFFRNELSQAIKEIRAAYEAENESRRNQLQSKFSLIYNEQMMELQRADMSPLYNEQQLRQQEIYRKELHEMQSKNAHMKASIEHLKNLLADYDRKRKQMLSDSSSSLNKTEKDILEAKRRLEEVNRLYEEASAARTTLQKEISTYRELLESQNGLRGCVDRIVQNAQEQALHNSLPTTTTTASSGITGIVRSAVITSASGASTITSLVTSPRYPF